jgi:DNA adenine methylase
VPPGKYKNPTICHPENLRAVAQILAKTDIYWGDYSQFKQLVDAQTLVYFDPPYKPISPTANFNSYSKDSFDDAEQLRLRNFYQSLDNLGAKLLLSNSDPPNKDSTNNFFQTAYSHYSIKKVQAKRNINSKARKRGKINEILVMNY